MYVRECPPYVAFIFMVVCPIIVLHSLLRAEEILCDIQQLVPSVHVCMSVCLLVLYE